tara:strand:- start:410 stop:3298 length:2889 start_codon:yes stop_codon:yes gene_type:complete
MIQLSPIDPLVQQTLIRKERILGNKSDSSIFDSRNEQEYLENKGPVALALRTTFTRMTSLSGKEPVIIHGGELIDGDLRSGLKTLDKRTGGVRSTRGDLVGSIYGPIQDQNTGKQTKNKYYRPIPGLKSVDVQYKGGMKALREGNISWTCWNFEDLERLTPYFLWHGKNILIEWGWSFAKAKLRPRLFDLNKISKITFDTDLVTHIRNQAGNYDAMIGTVTNYEYTSRSDGGFDCTTKIIARGVNMFRNTMPPINSKATVSTKIGHSNLVAKNPEVQKIEQQISFKSYIASLKEQLQWIHSHYSKHAEKEGKASGFRNLEGKVVGRKLGIVYEEETGIGPYCTLGFLEDNIISRFVGFVSGNRTLFEFRSIEPNYDDRNSNSKINSVRWEGVQIANHKNLHTAHPNAWSDDDPNALVIPGQFPLDETHIDPTVTTYQVTKYSERDGTARGTETKTYTSITENPNVKKMLRLKQLSDELPPFVVPNSEGNRGYVRNLLLHYKLIQNAFEDANTLDVAMNNLFTNINTHYSSFWDFTLSSSEDGKRMKIIDRRITKKPAEDYIKTKNSKMKEYKLPWDTVQSKYNYDGMYIFPVWEASSLVRSQNFTAKLPDKMALGALYGSGATYKNDGESDNEKDFSVTELGGDKDAQIFARLFNPNYDSKNESYRDRISGEISIAFKNNREFGNLTADENKSLSVGGVGTFLQTDIVGVPSVVPLATGKTPEGNRGHTINIVPALKVEAALEKKKKSDDIAVEVSEEEPGVWAWVVGKLTGKVVEPIPAVVTETVPENIKLSNEAGTSNLRWYGEHGDLKREVQKDMFNKIKDDDAGIHSTTDPLLNIELELDIDGTGGIFPGNVFHSSYLPKKIRKSTVYQAMDVSHRVDSSFWSTTIRGQMRYAGDGALKLEEKLKKELEAALFIKDKKTGKLTPKKEDQPKLEIRTSPSLEEMTGGPIARIEVPRPPG